MDSLAFSASHGAMGSECAIHRFLPSSDTDGAAESFMDATRQMAAHSSTGSAPGHSERNSDRLPRKDEPLISRKTPSAGRKSVPSPQFSM